VKSLFAKNFPDAFRTRARGKDPAATEAYKPMVEWFAGGQGVEISDESSAQDLYDELAVVPGLEGLARKHLGVERVEEVGPAMEFVLEGLHQNSILSRQRVDGGGTAYGDMLKSMFSGFQAEDDDQ
jgi:magnesium chelatase subunit I